MPLAKPMHGLQALRYEGLATLKHPVIPGFPSPSCGRGFKPLATLILVTLLHFRFYLPLWKKVSPLQKVKPLLYQRQRRVMFETLTFRRLADAARF
jgi:hypothetical protein